MITVNALEIENEWRPLKPAEKAIIPGKSQAAWTRILAHPRGRDIEEKMAAVPPVVAEQTVRSVMISMIVRVLKNPESARTISKGHDDWTKGLTLDSSVSTGELYLTEYELDLIDPPPLYPEYGMYVVPLGG